jgi:hypothetical protein
VRGFSPLGASNSGYLPLKAVACVQKNTGRTNWCYVNFYTLIKVPIEDMTWFRPCSRVKGVMQTAL